MLPPVSNTKPAKVANQATTISYTNRMVYAVVPGWGNLFEAIEKNDKVAY
jgi:hypothetical protein